MAINDIVQTIAEARVDARSLSEFVFKPAGFKVARRLAPTVDTLQFYINRFNSLDGDFSSSVSVALSRLNNSVAEADGKVAYIETTVQDAINNTAVEGGVLADTFVTMTKKLPDAIARNLRDVNNDTLNAKDFGFVGGIEIDNTDVLNAAFLAARTIGRTINVPDGIHRVDGTVTMESGGSVVFGEKCTLRRFKAHSSSTEPVFVLRGSRSCSVGGVFTTENNSPNGVLTLGHKDSSDSRNATWWRCSKPTVYGVLDDNNIGIHIPSGQGAIGSSTANYFGCLENPSINVCGDGLVFGEISNAHTVIAPQFYQCKTSAISFYGAYGNTILGGFMHNSPNGTTGVRLMDSRLTPSPHHSNHNRIVGFGIEPGGVLSKPLHIDAGCRKNTIEVLANVAGGLSDASPRGSNKYDTDFSKSYDNTRHNTINLPVPIKQTGEAILSILNQDTYYLKIPNSTEGAKILLGNINVAAGKAGFYEVYLTGELTVLARFAPVSYSFAYSRVGSAAVSTQVVNKTNFTNTAVSLVLETVVGSENILSVYMKIHDNGTNTAASSLSARLTHTANNHIPTTGKFTINPALLDVV